MDFLEANKDAIEAAIFHRVADLLNLDVDVVFYDTTSLHFEIDDEDTGDKNGNVRGSEVSGKTYTAPRQRGHSKNGRGDAPQIVVGMAVTLTAEDKALGYTQQQRVEEAWRTEDAPGVPLGAASHSRPHRHHRPVPAAGASRRVRVSGYMAQYPRRPQTGSTGAIVQPQRPRLAGHRAVTFGI